MGCRTIVAENRKAFLNIWRITILIAALRAEDARRRAQRYNATTLQRAALLCGATLGADYQCAPVSALEGARNFPRAAGGGGRGGWGEKAANIPPQPRP